MAKIVDITEKLDFEKPVMIIKGEKIKINDEAVTMLKTLSAFKENSETEGLQKAYELLFDEDNRKKIDSFHLGLKGWTTVIMEAVKLAQGDNDDMGETPTPDMT